MTTSDSDFTTSAPATFKMFSQYSSCKSQLVISFVGLLIAQATQVYIIRLLPVVKQTITNSTGAVVGFICSLYVIPKNMTSSAGQVAGFAGIIFNRHGGGLHCLFTPDSHGAISGRGCVVLLLLLCLSGIGYWMTLMI